MKARLASQIIAALLAILTLTVTFALRRSRLGVTATAANTTTDTGMSPRKQNER